MFIVMTLMVIHSVPVAVTAVGVPAVELVTVVVLVWEIGIIGVNAVLTGIFIVVAV